MLILSRKIDQRVHVGDDVTVTVVGVVGHHVRLGFEAPEGVVVDREEVRLRKLAEIAAHGYRPRPPVARYARCGACDCRIVLDRARCADCAAGDAAGVIGGDSR